MKTNLQSLIKRNFHKVALCGMLGLTSLGAFAQQNTNLGKVNSFKDLLTKNVGTSVGRTQSNNLKFQLPFGVIEAKVSNSFKKSGKEEFSGKILNRGKADFQVEFIGDKTKGFILLYSEKKAFEFFTNNDGNVELIERDYDKVFSVDDFNQKISSVVPASSSIGTPGTTGTGEQIPLLQSNPGASTVVYLDFDGEVVTSSYWDNGNTINAAKSQSSAAGIQLIYQMISEDYAPFNVNITTNRAIYEATPAGRRQMTIFTPTNYFWTNAGGVAYVNGFSYTNDLPCWVFNYNVGDDVYGEAGSHEIGHTFGLNHDGRNLPDGVAEGYYWGHGNWAPILGASYGKAVTQFSKGEYQYANNNQDDLATITAIQNAISFKIDDHANTTLSATVLPIVNNSFTKEGLISTPTDKDYFKFTSTGATATINVNSKYSTTSNLNVLAQILNSNNQVVFESNLSNSLSAEFNNVSLPAGDYYLVIDGIGEGDANTGYTDYGSLGGYVVSGTFIPTNTGGGCTDPAYNATTAYNGGQKVSYNNIIYTANWWTQGAQPDLNSGPVGTGKPWTQTGTCTQNVVPTVTVTSPTEGQVLTLAAGQKVNFTVTTTPSVVDSVKYILVDVVCNGPGCATVRRFTQTTAPYSLSVDPIAGAVSSQVNVVAFKNGRASDVTAAVNYSVVQAVKPVVTINSPVENQEQYFYPSDNNKVNVALGFNVAPSAIDSVRLVVVELLCNGPGCANVRKYTLTNATTFNLSYLPSLRNNGYTEMYAVAFSKGLVSDEVKRIFYAKPLPELTIVSPANNSSVSRSISSLLIDVNVNTTNLAIDSVIYFVSDAVVNGQFGTTTDRKFVVTSGSFDLNLPVLTGKTFTRITALAFGDGGKNSRAVSTQVNYSNAPVVTITSPVENQEINLYPSDSSKVNVNVGFNVAASTIDSVKYIVVEVVCNGPGCTNVRRFTSKNPSLNLSYLPSLPASGYTEVYATAFSKGVASDEVKRVFYAKPLPEVIIVSPTNNTTVTRATTSLLVDVDLSKNKMVIDSVFYNVSDFTGSGQTTTVIDRKFVVKTSPFDLNFAVRAGQNYSRITVVAFSGGKASKGNSTQVNYNDAPVVTITAPTVGSKFNVGGTVTVAANVTDDGNVSKVEIYSPHIANSTVTLTAAPYTATFTNLASSGNRFLTTFIVKATDNQGAVTVQTIDVAENRLPVIAVTAPLAVNGINPKYKVGYPVTVSANVSDQDGTIKKVVFTLPKTGETIVDSILPYSVTFANLPAPYADGTLYFTVTAFDNNNATSSTNVIVNKNRVPSATITSPVANATFNTNANITVTALPYDPDFTSGKIEYFVNGSSKIGEQIINSVLTAGTQYSVNFNNVANGIYDFTARITDDMGEFAYSPAVRVEVKTPNVTCTAPVYNATTAYNGGQSVQYNGIKYKANWWIQGAQPDINSGVTGSGKPWTNLGACTSRIGENVVVASATSIYPNPTSGLFTIETETEASAVILNAFGKEVATLNLVKGQNEVNLSLSSGIYFVKINNNVTKLVIE